MLARLMQKRPALRHGLTAAFIAAVAILALDQLTKYLVVTAMDLRHAGAIDVVPGVFNFRMAWNTGINFGLLGGEAETTRWILAIATSLGGLALLLGSLAAKRMTTAIGLGIAAGGALGNAIDRMTLGAVADFLNVSCCGIDNPWSFNVADIAIFFGFGLLLLAPGGKSTPQAPASAQQS